MTREEELLRIAKKLDKMVSRNNMDGSLDLLRELKNFNMTLKLLQDTRIGMSVNGIRKHCTDEDVVNLAKILIKNWKKLLESAQNQKSERPNEVKIGNYPMKPSGSPDRTSPERQSRKDSTDSNKQSPRKPSLDGWRDSKSKPETPKAPTTPTSPLSPSFSSSAGPLSPRLQTGDSIRDKCIEMLAAALRTDDDYKDYGANCEVMAAEIEDHVYQEIKATDMKYKNRVRSRISNLKDHKNPNLRKNVLAGAIELSRLASMTAEEMASDELKQLRNVLTQEAIREHQMAKTGGTTTDLLQCGKCRKKNCTYNQVQTRSADEPMTTFVLCNECGNRWKFC
ncbi:transcription elongation factor A protein 3-like isoform X5 [Xyrauchen texanus]|uniref:transcription elongation factor A protein 3-like isoform X5 n=1 Tax=Xyrauchen texanus TaxID=154827 RepID=UPI002241F793|nr:transcription elongation factor A protein 3-like isoform X5 [Xyrauchen texanus]